MLLMHLPELLFFFYATATAEIYPLSLHDALPISRLLEDVARTFAEHGANIVSYGGVVDDQLAKNWYTAELGDVRSEEHTSELQSRLHLVCRLLLEKKKKNKSGAQVG